MPTVRSITDPETLGRLEKLQIQIWGMSDREVVPLHQLVAAVSAGERSWERLRRMERSSGSPMPFRPSTRGRRRGTRT